MQGTSYPAENKKITGAQGEPARKMEKESDKIESGENWRQRVPWRQQKTVGSWNGLTP